MTDELTRIENESIRQFVQHAADSGYMDEVVLDYGCGKQPYRSIVESSAKAYVGFDRAVYPANLAAGDIGPDDPLNWERRWETILCTQVIQYIPNPLQFLWSMVGRCDTLVMSYPTNWPEVQNVDLHRFTKAGMERLLAKVGFTIVEHLQRASFEGCGYEWALGYGVICRS